VGDLGPVDAPIGVPENTGLLPGTIAGTVIVPANNLPAVEAALARFPGEIAGMILEPIMMNAGIIYPDDGYLEALKDLLHAHGALLTFDEVKTGFTVGPGGASGMLGVTSDLVCVAKAMGGGLSTAAIGGGKVMELVVSGDYQQVGTFNGNPLAMAAARAMLTEVLTDEAYAHTRRLGTRLADGLEEVVAAAGLAWTTHRFWPRSGLSFSPALPRTATEAMATLDVPLRRLVRVYLANRGVWDAIVGAGPTCSVAATDEDVDRYLAAFGDLVGELV
jgi:glutamate-1-semialdehyde 2,1-aminomutase